MKYLFSVRESGGVACEPMVMRERERERERDAGGRCDAVMLCVIYWLNEGCLSQFRQQGFSTLPARICNSHDTGRLTDLHWAFAPDLPQRR